MPPEPSSNPPFSAVRLPALDGVRGLAILAVLIWHLFTLRAVSVALWLKILKRLTLLTWTGVDLFFVLSGFLIVGILVDTRGRRDFFRRFWLRRALRILPLYYLVLATCFVIPVLKENLAPVASWPAYTALWQNWWMAWHGMGGMPLSVTWSLALEEQFYLLLPFLVWRLSRRGLGMALLFMLFLAPALRTALGGSAAYVLLPCRCDALAWGGLLALLARRPVDRARVVTWARLGVGIAAAAALVFTARAEPVYSRLMSSIGYSLLDLGAAGLVALAVFRPEGRTAGVLQHRALRQLGEVAYGLYLFHLPVLLLCWRYLGVTTTLRSAAAVLWGVGLPALLTFALALFSWRCFEAPIIALGRKHERRAHASVAISAARSGP